MRILIADREPKVRFALRTLLSWQRGLEVVGDAATAEELVAQVEATHPELLLFHWRLQETAPDLLSRVRRMCPHLSVIVLSARPEVGREALAAGVDAFVCKIDPPERLLAAIQQTTQKTAPATGVDSHGLNRAELMCL